MERLGHPGLDSGAPAHGAVVMAVGHVSRDVRRVCLALNTGALAFRPGQHVLLSAGGLQPRPYAIASLPNDPLLELHIQRRPTGLGAHAAERMRVGDRAVIWGPVGRPFPLENGGPILAAADGAGLSAVGSAVLSVLGADADRRVMLYVGARAASDLYDERLLRWLTERCPNFMLHVCVRDGAAADLYRQMPLGSAIAADRPDLRGATVIAAGAPNMVAGVMSAARMLGARPDRMVPMPFVPHEPYSRPHGFLTRWLGDIARPWIASVAG